MRDSISDDDLSRIFDETRVIALVGASPNETRASFFVGRYLSLRGYTVLPINPGHVGKTLFGQEVRASLADCPEADMVDIFRRSEAVPDIVDDAMAHLPNLRTIWMQIGVQHDATAQMARADDLTVVQNRCPKIEYQRLYGELRRAGVNTNIISSKLPRWRG